jgi:hypothetical protein
MNCSSCIKSLNYSLESIVACKKQSNQKVQLLELRVMNQITVRDSRSYYLSVQVENHVRSNDILCLRNEIIVAVSSQWYLQN